MKRFAAVLALLCLTLAVLCAMHVSAAPSVTFTVINDVFTQNLSSGQMPVRIGGQVYIPYNTLSRLMSVKYYYNEKEQRVLVYNFDYTLTFDLANSISYDESGVVYSHNAVRRSGTIFLPAALICNKFGFYFSYITSAPLGPIVRINTEEVTVPDSVLVEKAQERMQQIYDAYVASIEPSTDNPGDTSNPVTPSDPGGQNPPAGDLSAPANVYLAFEGPLNETTGGILDSLSQWDEKAAFFIAGEVDGQRDTLRRIFAEGHTIGLYVPGQYASSDELLRALDEQNEALCAVLHTKARLVWMPGSRQLTQQQRDALIGAGYRLWEDNLDPRADMRTAYSVRVNVRNILRGMQYSAVVRLLSNEASAEALPGILSDLRQAGNSVQTIREWSTPVNSAREIR